MLPGAVQARQLKRGAWFQDTLVDVRVMVEAWEAACAKLGAEAAVDGGAVKCTYLEPALPSAVHGVTQPARAAAPSAAAPSAAAPAPQPAAVPRPLPSPSSKSAVPLAGLQAQEPLPLLVSLG